MKLKTARLAMLLLGPAVGCALAAPETPAPSVAASAAVPASGASAAASPAQALFDRGVGALCAARAGRSAAGTADAARQMTLAAEQGHARAQSVLGWMYLSGTGVARDLARARHWLVLAAEQGESAAQNNLGVMFAQGLGVPRDSATAERWFRAAAEKGATDAQRNLQQLRGGPSSPTGPTGPDKRARTAQAAPPGPFIVNCSPRTPAPRG